MAAIISALADCLEALDGGPNELEECLRRHERYRQELVALLEIVTDLETVALDEEGSPSDEFRAQLKARLLREFSTKIQGGGEAA